MRLLVLGDLHLGEDGFTAEPHPSWERFDAVLTVGDVAHSRVTVVDGKPRQEELVGLEEARTFFRRLDDLGIPILTVPGNHDYRRHADLVREATRVRNLHREATALEGYRAIGLGSETFDDGPEVRYDPAAMTVPDEPDDADDRADPSNRDDPDAWLERALDRALRDESDAAIADLRERLDDFDRQFETYRDRYETLRSLASERESELGEADGDRTGTIALTHVPPFATPLDRVAESVPRIGGRHWGSIALKNLLTAREIAFVACGHIHEREGVATVAGTTCLNAGSRSAYDVILEANEARSASDSRPGSDAIHETDDVSITEAEPPLE